MKMDWRLIAAVAVGGALGSVARYLIGALIQDRFATALPVGTLAINISGSLLLGFLVRVGLETSAFGPEMRFFLTTGFCGGFTTFSTFSYETFRLFEDGEYGPPACMSSPASPSRCSAARSAWLRRDA